MLNPNISVRNKSKNIVALLLLFSILSVNLVASPAFAMSQAVVLSTEALIVTPTPVLASSQNPILDYTIDITSESAIVVEVGRGMKLYLKNPDMQMSISAASKIMTAVIAIESLPMDTKVTISKVAADQTDSGELSLVNGEKYALDYLLYGLILLDNDAAAIAIAEQISGEETDFVQLMNDKALSYKMEHTIFTNVTGMQDPSQYSTVSDVSRLIRYALTFPKFETILKTSDIPFFLSTNQTKHLFSNMKNAWSLVETTTGAFKSKTVTDSSFITTASSNGISIIIVGSTISDSSVIHDISVISSSIFSDYEYSTLVTEDQAFPKSIEVGKDTVGLRFRQEITYVHPKNVGFIGSTTYEPNETIEYPILTNKPVAKVVFELLDGTKITADLYPVVTIWGESSYIQQIILLYNANPDIGLLVIIAAVMLLFLLVLNIIRVFIRMNRAIYGGINTKKAAFGEHQAKTGSTKIEKNDNNDNTEDDKEIISKSDPG